MELKNSFHARFFCFYCLFSVCSSLRSCVLMRTFIFHTSCALFLFFYIYLYAIFTFIYLPCTFLFFIYYLLFFCLLTHMIVSIISRARKRLLMLRLLFLRVQLRLYFLLLLPFLFFYQSSVSAFSSFFLFSF